MNTEPLPIERSEHSSPASTMNVLVLGATGTAGMATSRALLRAGHSVSCLVRTDNDVSGLPLSQRLPEEAEVMTGDVSNAQSLQKDVFARKRFDAVVSCLTSRTGIPKDAWAIDHHAHSLALAAAKSAGVRHMVLLSAICVQKPLLAFQYAKLAFEKELIDSGLTYSIVRPTAFFKSLSGQIERVRNGKSFLLFGDGNLTACKPISDNDLGDYIADCLTNKKRHNQILPVGGPGNAITPREQGEMLFALTGKSPRFKHVPIGMLDAIRAILDQFGRFSKTCADKAELARIGRYYATESMLLINPKTGQYDAEQTPSTGTETLRDFYIAVLQGRATVERGAHAVFREQPDEENRD